MSDDKGEEWFAAAFGHQKATRELGVERDEALMQMWQQFVHQHHERHRIEPEAVGRCPQLLLRFEEDSPGPTGIANYRIVEARDVDDVIDTIDITRRVLTTPGYPSTPDRGDR